MTAADKARLELLGLFREEAQERINRITYAWITIEKNHDDEVATEELLRELHTLKGEAKMMGFADMGLLAHRTEELVLFAKDRGFDVLPAAGDTILAATDGLANLLHKRAGADEPSFDLTRIFARFDDVLAQLGGRRAEDDSGSPTGSPTAPSTFRPPRTQTLRLRRAGVEPDRFLRVDVESVSAFSLAASETVIAHARYRHSVRALRRLSGEVAETLAQIDRATGDNGSPARAAASNDALRDFRSRLEEGVDALREQINEGSVHATELEFRVRQLRLVPVAPLFKRYARAVRDLAVEHEKSVTVKIVDVGVTLDKIVVDKIADPLLHLVRNSVDHGLEKPAERRDRGKPEQGTVTLEAEQLGGNAVISVSDDGRGIDRDRVRSRALEAGLVSTQAAETLNEEELLALLFVPGFTTSETASETSGRGVGLDVVKHQVELLGGAVRVESPEGGGTRFELRVPISVALTRVLVVAAAGDLFAIPSGAVDQVMVLGDGNVEMVNNRRAVRFLDELVPVRSLASTLGVPQAERSRNRIVIVAYEGTRVALEVTECRSDVDVIVKSLGEVLATTRLFGGACTLEGGALALVFNPAELVPLARQEAPWLRAARPEQEAVAAKKRILFAEDSGITRAMVARILRALGYEVREAENGAEAMSLLEASAEPFDLILTDVDMPRMNGIELAKRVRAHSQWRNLPIVVLTTHGSDEDKQRAAAAGADAYLVKTEFSEATFREAIADQLGE